MMQPCALVVIDQGPQLKHDDVPLYAIDLVQMKKESRARRRFLSRSFLVHVY
jgi:hypothetical protein